MAFDKKFMAPVAGFGSVGPRLWVHVNLEDDTGNEPSQQAAAGYFDAALVEGFDIQPGDFIIAGESEAGGVFSDIGVVGIVSVIDGVVTGTQMGNPV